MKRSFWINLVFVTLIIFIIEYGLHRYFKFYSNYFMTMAIVYFVVFHVVVFIWQAIGVLRICDRNIYEYIHTSWARAAQFCVIITLASILIWAVTLGQSLLRHKIQQTEQLAIDNTIPAYILLVTKGNNLEIDGLLNPGITREVKKIVDEHNHIGRIILNSTGGNIFEARGLAKLIEENKIATHSTKGCYSACTTAYIAGIKRYLDSKAKLGFHQYAIDSKKLLPPNLNTDREQKKDLSFYQSKGIDDVFLQKIFSVPYNEIWFPTHAELIKSGIVNGIVYP